MTILQLKEKISMLRIREEEEINSRIEKALTIGAIDIASYDDNYLLPKIILTAVYSDVANLIYPAVIITHGEEIDNLKKFL